MSVTLDDLAFTPEGATELYRRIGRPLWALSFLEYHITLYMVLISDRYASPAEVEAALASNFSLTLGNLLKEFRKHVEISTDLDTRLTHIKEERDWLCHRIYRLSHTSLYDGDNFIQLLQRLDHLFDEVKDVARILEMKLDEWIKFKGITPEELERKSRQTIEEWKNS